jgi:hypothetical protein
MASMIFEPTKNKYIPVTNATGAIKDNLAPLITVGAPMVNQNI